MRGAGMSMTAFYEANKVTEMRHLVQSGANLYTTASTH